MTLTLERMTAALDATGPVGFVPTPLKGLHFFWSTLPVDRAPLIYPSGAIFILQGRKIGYLNDRQFRYDPDNFLILSFPLPFECETRASAAEPLMGFYLEFDRPGILDLVSAIGDDAIPGPARAKTEGFVPAPMTSPLKDSLLRLASTLTSPTERRAIGPSVLREVQYHLLCQPHGRLIRDLVFEDAHLVGIQRAVSKIRSDYADDLTTDKLAAIARMSAPTFHRAFQTITGFTPHRYLQETRLHAANRLIVLDGLPVSDAGRRAGYADPSHFSREFKKLFKVPPSKARETGHLPLPGQLGVDSGWGQNNAASSSTGQEHKF